MKLSASVRRSLRAIGRSKKVWHLIGYFTDSQKVSLCMSRSAELLQQRTSDAAFSALGIVAEALSISGYSEKLLEMKGEALCTVRKYNEAIQLCEETIDIAEKNFSTVGSANQSANMDDSECKESSVRLWRWQLMSKCYFYLGKLDAALDLIEKLEQLRSTKNKGGSMTQESSTCLVTVRDLLCRKVCCQLL
ncbi:unnamed protein product [Ilex paraguariensis]|uniref:Uncharacterized protein n=1 Tax=Ilex paraguariensis TaxID=185542 RepID=A0ABC8USU7_9AQUA